MFLFLKSFVFFKSYLREKIKSPNLNGVKVAMLSNALHHLLHVHAIQAVV
jgi:hypothetical protein